MMYYRAVMDDVNVSLSVQALVSPVQMATPQMILSFTGEVETEQCRASTG